MFGAQSLLALVANPPLPLLLLSGIKQVIKNSSALEIASGFIMSRLTFIKSLNFKHFLHDFMIFAIIYLKTKTIQIKKYTLKKHIILM